MGAGDLRSIRSALDEAPFNMHRWTDALNGVAKLIHASSAQLLTFGGGSAPSIIAPGFSNADIGVYAALRGPDPRVNPGVVAVMKAQPLSVVNDDAYMCQSERKRSALYHEFFEPHDGAHITFGVVRRAGSSTTVANIFFSRRRGPLSSTARRQLQNLMPHFERTAILQARLEEQAAQIAVGSLDAVHAAVLLCDIAGRVVDTTARAEEILRRGDVLTTARGVVRTRAPSFDSALEAAVRRAAVSGMPAEATTLLLPAPSGGFARVDVQPLPSAWLGAAFCPLAMIHVREPTQTAELNYALVNAAFQLTPAETDIAAALILGDSSADIAARRNSSLETVNSQVKAILAKTGCARRAQLPLALQPFLAAPFPHG